MRERERESRAYIFHIATTLEQAHSRNTKLGGLPERHLAHQSCGMQRQQANMQMMMTMTWCVVGGSSAGPGAVQWLGRAAAGAERLVEWRDGGVVLGDVQQQRHRPDGRPASLHRTTTTRRATVVSSHCFTVYFKDFLDSTLSVYRSRFEALPSIGSAIFAVHTV